MVLRGNHKNFSFFVEVCKYLFASFLQPLLLDFGLPCCLDYSLLGKTLTQLEVIYEFFVAQRVLPLG